MNEKQAELMLKTLKRMEQLLEAIDWKMWNFHQKLLSDNKEVASSSSNEDEETEQLASMFETPRPAARPAAPAAPAADTASDKKAGFPSVEKWS